VIFSEKGLHFLRRALDEGLEVLFTSCPWSETLGTCPVRRFNSPLESWKKRRFNSFIHAI